jgi:hypothetical protein
VLLRDSRIKLLHLLMLLLLKLLLLLLMVWWKLTPAVL